MQTPEGNMCNAGEHERRHYGSKRYSQGEMTLNVKHRKMVTQGPRMNMYNGSKR